MTGAVREHDILTLARIRVLGGEDANVVHCWWLKGDGALDRLAAENLVELHPSDWARMTPAGADRLPRLTQGLR